MNYFLLSSLVNLKSIFFLAQKYLTNKFYNIINHWISFICLSFIISHLKNLVITLMKVAVIPNSIYHNFYRIVSLFNSTWSVSVKLFIQYSFPVWNKLPCVIFLTIRFYNLLLAILISLYSKNILSQTADLNIHKEEKVILNIQ